MKTSKDKLEAAEVLLTYEADPNFCSLLVGNTWTKNAYFTETNVHRAVVTNHIKFVDLFVSHGADLTIPNAKGSNPLHNICFCGQLDMLKVILRPRCESNVSISMALTKGMVILLYVISHDEKCRTMHPKLTIFKAIKDHLRRLQWL